MLRSVEAGASVPVLRRRSGSCCRLGLGWSTAGRWRGRRLHSDRSCSSPFDRFGMSEYLLAIYSKYQRDTPCLVLVRVTRFFLGRLVFHGGQYWFRLW